MIRHSYASCSSTASITDLALLSKAFLNIASTSLIKLSLLSLNSSKIGPIKKPSDAKACPPQFKPDSILYSETHKPFLAKNLP